MTTEEKLIEITESCKQDYIDDYNSENHVENILLVSDIQGSLAERLKGVSASEEHSQLIKDLHKQFIDFSTNY
jgi:signal recognition particle GTPase